MEFILLTINNQGQHHFELFSTEEEAKIVAEEQATTHECYIYKFHNYPI